MAQCAWILNAAIPPSDKGDDSFSTQACPLRGTYTSGRETVLTLVQMPKGVQEETVQVAQPSIHWKALTLIIASLIAGVCLAVGHHAFYFSLQGSPVHDEQVNLVGWKTTPQQLNLAAGNAFAFLVKASLVLATSTAYMQLFFRAMQMEAFTLDHLDQWYSGLNDLFSLFRVISFYRYPLLALIAITAWLLPIAAIVAPASLSVVFNELSPISAPSSVPVPALESLSFSYFDYFDLSGDGNMELQRLGPSQEVANIAQAAMSTGDILPISPPGVNTSWTIITPWPHMICDDMDKTVQQDLKDNIASYLKGRGGPEYSYYSWVKRQSYANLEDAALPFTTNSSGNWTFNYDAMIPMGPFPPDLLYIAVIPRAGLINSLKNMTMDEYFVGSTLLQCGITDRLSTIRFSYDGADQAQHIRIESAINSTGLIWDDDYSRFKVEDVRIASGGKAADDQGSEDYPRIGDESLGQVFRRMSYASIFQTFSDVLLGTWPEEDLVNWSWVTQAFATSLVGTNELKQLLSGSSTNASALATADSSHDFDLLTSIMRPGQNINGSSMLKDAIEELFFNVTVSMASTEALLYNSTSPYSPDMIEVTQILYGTTYSYAPEKLWLAYGVAILVTLVNVCIGMATIFRSRSCFTSNFSTVVRLARNAEINADLRESGGVPGSDPLSKGLSDATFSLMAASGGEYVELVEKAGEGQDDGTSTS